MGAQNSDALDNVKHTMAAPLQSITLLLFRKERAVNLPPQSNIFDGTPAHHSHGSATRQRSQLPMTTHAIGSAALGCTWAAWPRGVAKYRNGLERQELASDVSFSYDLLPRYGRQLL